MKRWSSRMASALFVLVMLSGCIASQTETKINADGSGTNVMKVGIASEYYSMFASGGSDSDPLKGAQDTVKDLPAEWGATATEWTEKLEGREFKGARIEMKFKDLAMLNAQLQKLTEQSSSSSPAANALSDLSIKEVNGDFVISGTANATDLGVDLSSLGGGSGDDESSKQMQEEMRKSVIVWEVTMPGEVKSFGPDAIATKSGNTVAFKIPADKTETYNLSITAGKSGGAAGSLPLILGVVGGLVLLAGLAFFFMNRRKAAPVAAGYGQPPTSGSPGAYDPNAGYGQPPTSGSPGGYGQQPGTYGQQPGTYDPNAGYGQPPTSGSPGGYGQQPGTYDPNDPNRR